jgi:hypothetical protein
VGAGIVRAPGAGEGPSDSLSSHRHGGRQRCERHPAPAGGARRRDPLLDPGPGARRRFGRGRQRAQSMTQRDRRGQPVLALGAMLEVRLHPRVDGLAIAQAQQFVETGMHAFSTPSGSSSVRNRA